MTVIEENEKFSLVSFLGGCRVWYMVEEKRNGKIHSCTNEYNVAKSTYDKKTNKNK